REYQARIDCAQRVETEANTVQVSGRMVFDQYVGARDERAEDLGAGRRCGIECKALLAGVEIEERAALLWMRDVAGKRRMRAHLVAGVRRFNLDDIGAHVGEHLPA